MLVISGPLAERSMIVHHPRFQAVFDLIDQGMSCKQASKIIGVSVNKACDAWA